MCNLHEEVDKNKVAIKNILDIGDFLRREKRQSRRQQGSRRLRKHDIKSRKPAHK
jgi:hypothetical protein